MAKMVTLYVKKGTFEMINKDALQHIFDQTDLLLEV